ncbi:MAG TPA: methyltransferase [Acidobacteriaceae bacterium]|nr:methyltransferase [Acidobacteriaceae bacterium]
MKLNMITLAAVIIAVVLLLLHAREVEWNAAMVLGGAIAAAAFPAFVVARIQLGGAFSYKPKAQKLVTTGLYARIRNPVYFFGGLVVLGLSLFLSEWGPLVVLLVLVPLQKFRSRKEAEVLTETFGEEYLRYRSKTWF